MKNNNAIKIKQKVISMNQYNKECSKIIAKKMNIESTLIALLEMANKYQIKD